MTLREAVLDILRNPWRRFIQEWNWKSALFSSLIRGGIFFVTNRSAGSDAAAAAMLTEAVYAAATAGFWGSLVQVFRRVDPPWQAGVALGLAVPGCAHLLEATVHWFQGTPNLGASVLASISFSALSTLFNLHMMRQGVMVVGRDQRPLLDDFRKIPFVIAGFLLAGLRLLPRTAAGLLGLLSRTTQDKVI